MTPYYDDGDVVIYHGDCREVVPALGLTPSLVLADPPYGETSLAWDRWPIGWPSAMPTATPQLWCFGSMRMLLKHHRAGEFDGWEYGQEVVWEKQNGSGFQADRFKRVHEFATQWYRGPWSETTRNVQFTNDATARAVRRKGRPAHMGEIDGTQYATVDGGPRMMRSVIYARNEHGRAVHPTQKPTEIVEPILRYSTNPGDLVLDPFMGSGTTLLVARANGRRAVGIEGDERFCEAAAKRLSADPIEQQELAL